MLKNNFTVNSLRDSEDKIHLNTQLIRELEYGEPDLQQIVAYAEKLEAFLSDKTNTAHTAYYEAIRHHELVTEFIQLSEDEQKQEKANRNKNDFFSRTPRLTLEELDQKLTLLIEQENNSEGELTAILGFIAREAGIHPLELKKVYESKKIKIERKQFRQDTKRELNHLIKLENSKLDVSDYLPSEISQYTLDFCNGLDLRPESALLGILTTLSSCYPLSSQIYLRKRTRYFQNGTLYGVFVAEPGSMKSVVPSLFSSQPLATLQEEFQNKFKRREAEYKELEQEYKNADRETRRNDFPQGLPDKPERANKAYLTQTTVEAYATYFAAYPDKRILIICDEIKRLFDSMNQYKGGSGGDEQAYLEMYDGGAISSGRVKAESNYFIPKTALSIFGTTQFTKLRELWGDGNDSDGMFSRFLYISQKNSNPKFEPEDQEIDCPIVEKLDNLYYWANYLKPQTYTLSKAAYKRYAAFCNFLGERSKQSYIPFMQHAYSKARGHCGRLAMNLHILAAYTGNMAGEPLIQVEEETITKAIALTNFFLGQAEFLYKDLCDEETISPILKSILELSQRLGWIGAREVKRNRRQLRNVDSEVIRQHFLELKELGKGEVNGSGSRLKFQLFTPK